MSHFTVTAVNGPHRNTSTSWSTVHSGSLILSIAAYLLRLIAKLGDYSEDLTLTKEANRGWESNPALFHWGTPLSGTQVLTVASPVLYHWAIPLSGTHGLTVASPVLYHKPIPLSGTQALTVASPVLYHWAILLSGTQVLTVASPALCCWAIPLSGPQSVTVASSALYHRAIPLSGTQVLTAANPVLYHWGTPLSHTGQFDHPVSAYVLLLFATPRLSVSVHSLHPWTLRLNFSTLH